jgi:hypothetical protein
MTVKKEEFLALKQGSSSISEYRDMFLQLSRYAPEDVNTDAKRQYCFLRGLVDPLQYQLMNHTFLSAFRPWGVPGPTSKLSPRVPAQMGRRETEHEGGKGDRQKGETRGLRVVLRLGRVRLQ